MSMVLKGALVYADRSFHEDLDVRIENGRILSLGANLPGEAVDLKGARLLPGLIDVHTHGDFGYSYGGGEESVRAIARQLPQTGVTSVLATICDTVENLAEAHKGIARVHDNPKTGEARILGTHFEAPFIATTNLGIIKREFCVPVSLDDYLKMTGGREDIARLITLSPELPGALEFIKELSARGIRVSAGHTNASFELMSEAFCAGVSHITHLFNAMNPLHHRSPGVPCAALTSDVTVELICDGIHLHNGILKLVESCKKPDQICLVTDSSILAGLPDAEYEVDGRAVVLQDGAARLKIEGNLASSTLTVDKALRHMIKHTGFSEPEIIDMATAVPARVAGEKSRGSITLENYADLVVVDRDYYPLATIVEGTPVWQAQGLHYFEMKE